jgi:TPR repeat protein
MAESAGLPESPSDAADAEDTEKVLDVSKELVESVEDRSTAESTEPQAPEKTEQQDSLSSEEPDARADEPPTQSRAETSRFDLHKLVSQGTSHLDDGDTVSARRFFELASRQGSAEAAMLVGVTYDPRYFQLTGVVGMRPDADKAAEWYSKAIAMGSKESASRLQTLKEWLASRSR